MTRTCAKAESRRPPLPGNRWLCTRRFPALSSLSWVLVASAAFLIHACAFTQRDIISYHSFNYEAPSEEVTSPVAGTLMVYRFLLDPAVERNFLMVAKPKQKPKSLTHQRWTKSPSDMITDLIQRDIARAGLFSKTVGQLSSEHYNYALQGTVRRLGGKISKEKPAAVMEVQVTLLDFGVPIGAEKTLMKRVYKIVKPCKDSTPAGIIGGLNEAVKELSLRVRKDIRRALENSGRIHSSATPDSAPADVKEGGVKGMEKGDKSTGSKGPVRPPEKSGMSI